MAVEGRYIDTWILILRSTPTKRIILDAEGIFASRFWIWEVMKLSKNKLLLTQGPCTKHDFSWWRKHKRNLNEILLSWANGACAQLSKGSTCADVPRVLTSGSAELSMVGRGQTIATLYSIDCFKWCRSYQTLAHRHLDSSSIDVKNVDPKNKKKRQKRDFMKIKK